VESKKVVEAHYQKHTITEIEHFPEHGARTETLEFRNAKHELESIEHLGCYICGTMEQRESHHIFERAYMNGLDVKKVAYMLYNHYDYHGHCKRDFESSDELYNWFMQHFNGHIEKWVDEGGVEVEYSVCDDVAADTLYVQMILCETHHRGMGTGAHGSSAPTFYAWMARRPGFDISMNEQAYNQLLHEHKESI
jgi:hypothetical protein